MYLHSATFDWDPMQSIHENDLDIETIRRLPQRGVGRVHFDAVEGMERAILFLTAEEIEEMAEDMFMDEAPEFQRLVRALLDFAKTHPPSSHEEYTFVLSY